MITFRPIFKTMFRVYINGIYTDIKHDTNGITTDLRHLKGEQIESINNYYDAQYRSNKNNKA